MFALFGFSSAFNCASGYVTVLHNSFELASVLLQSGKTIKGKIPYLIKQSKQVN